MTTTQGGAMAKKKAVPSGETGLKEQIREAIRNSGQSLHQLGDACNIGADRLSRFVRGERRLSLEAAEKLCQVLHLGLSPLPGEPPARKVRPRPEGEAGHPEAEEKPAKKPRRKTE